jgi:flagellar hook-length control protein FliK
LLADSSRLAVMAPAELQASASQLSPEAGIRAKEATSAELAARQPALMQALGERIKVQIAQGSERAMIRLDPPMMGRLEIVIRHEAGVLQVQLHASHGEVARQLQQMSDGLRQELGQRQFSDVSVLVSHGSEHESAGRQRNGQEPDASDPAPGRALVEAEAGHEHSLFTLA